MATEHETEKPVDVTVAIADTHLLQYESVVRRCRKVGLKVTQQLKTVGIVNGLIEQEKINALEKVEGVDHVERARSFSLPPPESDVQ